MSTILGVLRLLLSTAILVFVFSLPAGLQPFTSLLHALH